MAEYFEVITNAQTGEQTVRPYTEDEIAALSVLPSNAEQESNRQAAFQAEADPLFFKWQAGEGTEAEWLAKREEIRTRFPYPSE
jgi:hypothetical protein